MAVKLIRKKDLNMLLEVLSAGYEVVAPVKVDDQYTFSKVESADQIDLGFPLTMLPIKKYLIPYRETMFKIKDRSLKEELPKSRYAFLGLHICDINGITRLDMEFANDPYYRARREQALIIGVSCKPVQTCFCKSMHANELVPGTWDLFMQDGGEHYIVYSGSEAGRRILNSDFFEPCTHEANRIVIDYEESSQIDVHKVWKGMLADYNNPVWEETGKRCLGCANCTVVCPLCYCYDVLDISDVEPDEGERIKCWDSCLLLTFARVSGGHNFRKDMKSRYRNVYMHKFRTYVDIFNTPACVGCGRCVTFCPAGIDMRETLKRLGGA